MHKAKRKFKYDRFWIDYDRFGIQIQKSFYLNTNGLNARVKRQAKFLKLNRMLFTIITLKHKPIVRLTGKGRKKTFHKNANQNKAGTAILVSEKIDV